METTSATAQLVGTRDMLAAHPNAVTTTIARGDIEEAVSSDLPTELFLDVLRPAHAGVEAETRTVTVMWDRADLDEEGIATVDEGRRRLLAPEWKRL